MPYLAKVKGYDPDEAEAYLAELDADISSLKHTLFDATPEERTSYLEDLTERGRLGEWGDDDTFQQTLEQEPDKLRLRQLYEDRLRSVQDLEQEEERRHAERPWLERTFTRPDRLTPSDLVEQAYETPAPPSLTPAAPSPVPPAPPSKQSATPSSLRAMGPKTPLPQQIMGAPRETVDAQMYAPPSPVAPDLQTEAQSVGETMVQAANAFVQGGAQASAGIVESVAITAKMLDEKLPVWMQAYGDKRAEELATYEIGKSLRAAAKKHFPTDPARQKEFLASVLPQAMGNMMVFIGGGLGARAIGGSSMAAAGTLGAGVEGAGQYAEAGAAGADEPVRREAFLWGLGLGTTEMLPIQRMFNRLNKAGGGRFAKTLRDAGTSGLEESLQEFGQTVGGNKVAQELYDEHRDLLEGAGLSAAAGGTSAVIFNVLLGGLSGQAARRRRQEPEPQPKTVTEQVTESVLDAAPVEVAPEVAPATQIPEVSPEIPPMVPPATSIEAALPEAATPEPIARTPLEQEIPPTPADLAPQVPPAPAAARALESSPAAVEPVMSPETPGIPASEPTALPRDAPVAPVPAQLAEQEAMAAAVARSPESAMDPAHAIPESLDPTIPPAALTTPLRDVPVASPPATPVLAPEQDLTPQAPGSRPRTPEAEAMPPLSEAATQQGMQAAMAAAKAEGATMTPKQAKRVVKLIDKGMRDAGSAEAYAATLAPQYAPVYGAALQAMQMPTEDAAVTEEVAPVKPPPVVAEPITQIPQARSDAVNRAAHDDLMLKVPKAWKERYLAPVKTQNRHEIQALVDSAFRRGQLHQDPYALRIQGLFYYREKDPATVEAAIEQNDETFDPAAVTQTPEFQKWWKGYLALAKKNETKWGERRITTGALKVPLSIRQQVAIYAAQNRLPGNARDYLDKADEITKTPEFQEWQKTWKAEYAKTHKLSMEELDAGEQNAPITEFGAREQGATAIADTPPDAPLTELGAREAGATAIADAPTQTEATPETPDPDAPLTELAQSEHDLVAPTTPRIEPAGIAGQTPKPLRQILSDASNALGKKLWRGKTRKGQAGVYQPGSGAVVLKHANDLDTAAHELSHALDDRFDLIGTGANFPFDNELSQFWQHGSVTKTGPHAALNYKRAEGVAEWLRAYLVNPDQTRQDAPRFTEHALGQMDGATIQALEAFGKDIRVFAGATGLQQIQANIAEGADQTTAFQRLHTFLTSNPASETPGWQPTLGDRLARQWTDRMAPMMKAYEFARGERGISKVLPKDDPRILARLYLGINSQMDDIMEQGMVGPNKQARATEGGFKWLLEPLKTTTGAELSAERKEVAAYMVAQRTLEKAKQLGREKQISGAGAGIFTDAEVARKTIAEVEADPEKRERFEEAARRYRQWANATLQYLVSQGRLSQEQYDGITENNEQYVAMQRIIEVTPEEDLQIMGRGGGGKLGSAAQPIQAFKGSALTIKDPYESLMDATYKAVREADRNRVMLAFVNPLRGQRGLHEGKAVDLASVGRLGKQGDKQTITVYRQGEQEHWQLHPDVYRAVKGLQDGLVKWPMWATVLPQVLRNTIVNAPPFAFRNFLRDAQQRAIITDDDSRPWDSLKRYKPLEIEQLKKFGGDQAGHYYQDEAQYNRAMKTAIKELAEDRNSVVLVGNKLAQGYLNFMQGSERQGRMSEYRRAFKAATTDGVDLGDGTKTVLDEYNAGLYAASKARGLLDFAVAGETLAYINKLVPFANAAAQGLRVTAKAAQRNPTRFTSRFLAYSALPAVLTLVWNAQGGDLEEYRQIPTWQRDLFYNFKLGPDLWLRFPKAFEVGVVGTTFERALDRAMGNKKAFEGHFKQFLETILPVDESALAGPFQGVAQALANYEFFRQRHIVPTWEENLKLDLRNTERSSRLAQTLQKLVGVDARKIDFLTRNQFGYFGQYAAKASDIGRENRRSFGIDDIGLFRGSPATTSQDVAWVKDLASERGATQTKVWRNFKQDYLTPYYEATTNAQRDRLAKRMRQAATRLRREWERTPPRPDAEREAAKKTQQARLAPRSLTPRAPVSP